MTLEMDLPFLYNLWILFHSNFTFWFLIALLGCSRIFLGTVHFHCKNPVSWLKNVFFLFLGFIPKCISFHRCSVSLLSHNLTSKWICQLDSFVQYIEYNIIWYNNNIILVTILILLSFLYFLTLLAGHFCFVQPSVFPVVVWGQDAFFAAAAPTYCVIIIAFSLAPSPLITS